MNANERKYLADPGATLEVRTRSAAAAVPERSRPWVFYLRSFAFICGLLMEKTDDSFPEFKNRK